MIDKSKLCSNKQYYMNGDFDTVGVFYALKTENGEQKKIEINRFFKESKCCETGWIEITRREYSERKHNR